MSGLLSEHPLAELIHEIHDERLSGVLRLARERARGAVYFDEGRVVHALTNLRAYRLTEALRRSGAVPAAKLDATISHEMPDEAAGAALVSAGLITREELGRLRARLATEVVRQLLHWTDGEWDFDSRVRLEASQRVSVEAGQLVVEAARRLAPAFAAKSFQDAGEKLSPAEGATTKGGVAGVQLLPAEGFVLSRFDAPLSVREVGAISGLPEGATREAVYVLMLGGLLRRERPCKVIPRVATAPKKATPASELTKTDEALESDTDGQTNTPEPSLSETIEAVRDIGEELAELFERGAGESHYAVLGVGRLSKPEEIKRAYYALARRFHPDRFQRHTDEAERQRVELAFAKIAQAYEVLKDASLRAAYDLKLSALRGPAPAGSYPPGQQPEPSPPRASAKAAPTATAEASPSASPTDPLSRAEELFRAGQAALGQNNYAAATKCLGEAVLLAPQQARYRAYFGRLLAREKATRRQAEAELQAAIALDARNASYRVMLAELYRDVGLRRRARNELEQALSIDRTNEAARRLLDELRRNG